MKLARARTCAQQARAEYRIEGDSGLRSQHWQGGSGICVHDRSLAVAMAVKSRSVMRGGEIRVVHLPSGEVIFRKHG